MEQEILEFLKRHAEATRTKNVEVACSAQASERVEFLMRPPLCFGVNDGLDESHLASWFAMFDGPIGFEHRDVVVTAEGEIAFVSCLAHWTGKFVNGGEMDVWYRQTYGLRQIDGDWKIVHLHESVPFYMDGSFRAAVDLKP